MSTPTEGIESASLITQRQWAAVTLKVPDSGVAWLDAMIRQANQRDAALQTLQGLLATGNSAFSFNEGPQVSPDRAAVIMATAVLGLLEKEAR